MRRHHFDDSGIDVLPLGSPVDLAAVAADDALIDALSGDVLAELLADDVLIEALVARMPPGTAPPAATSWPGYWPGCWPRGWPRHGGPGRGTGIVPRDPTDLEELSNGRRLGRGDQHDHYDAEDKGLGILRVDGAEP